MRSVFTPNFAEAETTSTVPREIDENVLEYSELADKTQLHFVYCFHHEHFSEAVLEEIKDADVVAIEYIHPQEARDSAEVLANRVTHTDERIDISKVFGNSRIRFLHDILEQLRGTNKDIRFIDAAEDSLIFKMTVSADRQENAIYEALFQRSLGETRSAVLAQITMAARATRLREELVRQQVADLVADRAGEKVAVVQGALHSGTSHVFSNQNHLQMTRSFVPESEGSFKRDFRELTPEIIALRAKRFFPHEDLSPELINYALLEYYLSGTTLLLFTHLEVSPDQVNAALADISVALDDPSNSEDKKYDLIENIVTKLPKKPPSGFLKFFEGITDIQQD